MDVAWGAQIVAALIVEKTGLVGLHLAAVAVVAGTGLLLARRLVLTPTVLAFALLFTLTGWFRFLVRPDLLIFPFTVAVLALLDRLPRLPRSSLIALAALTVAWANLHGSFALAPILAAASALGILASRPRPGELKAHASAVLVTALAPLANPYGYRLYALFAPYIRSFLAVAGVLSPVERSDISEWTPTWRALVHGPTFPRIPFILLVAALAVSFVRVGRRIPWGRLFGAAVDPRLQVIPMVLLTALLVCWVAVLVPLRRALTIQPAAALRGE